MIKKSQEINPFDLLSGKVVKNEHGTFWFKEAGYNMQYNGLPIDKNLYREDDLPVIIFNDGTQMWMKNGKAHRDNDLPAIIWSNGSQEWVKNGKAHRDNDLPSVIHSDGRQYWHKNGRFIKCL